MSPTSWNTELLDTIEQVFDKVIKKEERYYTKVQKLDYILLLADAHFEGVGKDVKIAQNNVKPP